MKIRSKHSGEVAELVELLPDDGMYLGYIQEDGEKVSVARENWEIVEPKEEA